MVENRDEFGLKTQMDYLKGILDYYFVISDGWSTIEFSITEFT